MIEWVLFSVVGAEVAFDIKKAFAVYRETHPDCPAKDAETWAKTMFLEAQQMYESLPPDSALLHPVGPPIQREFEVVAIPAHKLPDPLPPGLTEIARQEADFPGVAVCLWQHRTTGQNVQTEARPLPGYLQWRVTWEVLPPGKDTEE